MGFCPQCRVQGPLTPTSGTTGRPVPAVSSGSGRLISGIGEVDRVLGGGLVPGSAVLVGGEPGIGKSTLLLQLAGSLRGAGHEVLVATAEESVDQVALRAERIGCEGVTVIAEADVDAIVEHGRMARSAVIIVDSIQTVSAGAAIGVPGGVNQVRESALRLVRYGKEASAALILVGHVTKDGLLAGPKQLEHLVDVVVSLEGEAELGLRILRSQKNRFGATHQIGLFAMTDAGLTEVTEPLLDAWSGDVPGTVAFAGLEGRRSVLVEIQALVAESATPQPRRSVKGLQVARLHQILAVLDRHAGASFRGLDVYVNVTGGIQVREPAADLPVAMALMSSLLDRPLGRTAAWGEVGLTGEVRAAFGSTHREQEAQRAGLAVVAPAARRMRLSDLLNGAGMAFVGKGPVVASGIDGQAHAFVPLFGPAEAGTGHRAS